MNNDEKSELIVDVLLRIWTLNKDSLDKAMKANIAFNQTIVENATVHGDAWAKAKAYLDTADAIAKADMRKYWMEFLTWSMTHFPSEVLSPKFLQLVKDTHQKADKP